MKPEASLRPTKLILALVAMLAALVTFGLQHAPAQKRFLKMLGKDAPE